MTKECHTITPEEKKKFHEAMEKAWHKIPETLHAMIHSLLKQKKAVLQELHTWAKNNNEHEITKVSALKMDKVDCKLKKLEEEE